jgi:hypothetical protein
MLRRLNDDHTAISRGAAHFYLLSRSTENSFAFFQRGWRDDPAHPTSFSGMRPAPNRRREKRR